MALEFTTSYLQDSIAVFQQYRKLAEGAMAQLSEEQLTAVLDPEMNSIALIVKHVSGNLRSRWTDFLTTDGEKPDRDRDAEFEAPPVTREAVMALWEQGWSTLFATLESLTDRDLTATVTIRGEALSAMQALNRSIAHTASHVGQIVFLAKHLQSANWKPLSVPRGQSADYTRKVVSGEASQR